MKNQYWLHLTKIILLIALSSGFVSSTAAQPLCQAIHRTDSRIEFSSIEKRKKIIARNEVPSLTSLLNEMQAKGKLIYKGQHQYAPGTEFLASNEGDWTHTPFDHKPTDLVIAFGTNSSWEIAVNKKTQNLVIGDWSPYPLLAQAYLVEPMMRISKTPTEFILNLAGLPLEGQLTPRSLDDAFEAVRAFRKVNTLQKMQRTEKFLQQLAENRQISDSELKFLSSYFQAMAGNNPSPRGMGPFQFLRSGTFADLPGFFKYRYGTAEIIANTSANHLETSQKYGALLSQENFSYLKSLYDQNHVRLALTSITDTQFYAKVAQDYSVKNLSDITLSITNVFDCGCYNGLTFQDLQRYLISTFQLLGRSSHQPMTVFRTANNQPPHGFYRYDIKGPQDIPKLDEFDSSALHEPPQLSPHAAGW